ncbi:hypothetical protein CROQUDRAFT_666911 [Cronartium quercuum f. sp. fusiforme G11]|uniref:Ubiquitin carboxyl-terminal hydrolase n=1 Tax=Cronartium quercuum f. sp. fusiforme G11 TaxID=708437 RepID=A0A9P6N5Q9_9BASI|nr:hypothetical protein CROQUDRAFT_666911 [Cronartium quercuum f. sp. fusiforme G11]
MRWLPLESNPEVMNQWSSALGLSTDSVSFTDIYGLDEELLAMIPTPVFAVVMLFPITEEYENFRAEENSRVLKEREQKEPEELKRQDESVMFIKQTISNACGTMGLLHALANNPSLPLAPGPLKSLIEKFQGKTPLERAKMIEEDLALEEVHTRIARSGQSRVPGLEEELNLHFVCFIKSPVSNHLIELDGRKEFPIEHGNIEGDLLQAVVPVVRRFMNLAKDDVQFNLIALCPTLCQP